METIGTEASESLERKYKDTPKEDASGQVMRITEIGDAVNQ